MEKKTQACSFRAPICKIHKSEYNTLNHICFHVDCANIFKSVCFACATDPEIHAHHQKGISYKQTRKTLEELEILASAKIPLKIGLLSEEIDKANNLNTQLQTTSGQLESRNISL